MITIVDVPSGPLAPETPIVLEEYHFGVAVSPCGHPIQCRMTDEDSEYCAWCAEVKALKRTIDDYRR